MNGGFVHEVCDGMRLGDARGLQFEHVGAGLNMQCVCAVSLRQRCDRMREMRAEIGRLPVMQRRGAALVFEQQARVPAREASQFLEQRFGQSFGAVQMQAPTGIATLEAVQAGRRPAIRSEEGVELGQGPPADERDGAIAGGAGRVQ